MAKFYVSMTWDDFPEGGSFGQTFEAVDHDDAEKQCREAMAEARASAEYPAAYYLEHYADEWHVIDCHEETGASHAAALEAGVALARRVVANWSAGDLAGAVNALEEWADSVEADFPALDFSDDEEESTDEHA